MATDAIRTMMYIHEVLTTMMIHDIERELIDSYGQGELPDISEELTLESFTELIHQGIPTEYPEFQDLMVRRTPPDADDGSYNQCCARSWNRKRGTRCTKSRIQGRDYCKSHSEQCTTGGPRLGRYDGDRPVLNESRNLFDWDDGIEHLETVLRYQRALIHRLLRENGEVTP